MIFSMVLVDADRLKGGRRKIHV